jgi:CheY-like chemotaxis protein
MEQASSDVQAAPMQRRVLVVDDNVDAAETLTMLLELLGHEARAAHDGASALALARDFRPEITFLDIGLPGMSGHEVARQFRDDAGLAGCMLVALTGWGTEDDKRRCQEAGFDLHLTKPVDPAAIEEALACWRGPVVRAGAAERLQVAS